MSRRSAWFALGSILLAGACGGSTTSQPNPPPGGTTPALALRIGGTGFDQVVDLASDPDGSVYVTGTFTGSVDFDPGAGLTVLNSAGLADIFLAKYSSTGALVWAERMGGTAADTVTSLARDAAGNLYLAGGFEGSADLDPGAASQLLTSAGGADGFIAKYTSAGALVWSRRYGGAAYDQVADVAVDQTGNVYAAGVFQGQADLLPATGGQILSNGNVPTGFLISLDPAGAARWAYPIGGVESARSAAVAVTSLGSVVVAGAFRGHADFPSGLPVRGLTSTGGSDGFVARYTSAGLLTWLRAITGPDDQDVQNGGLATNSSDGVVVSGSFAGSGTFATDFTSTTFSSSGPSDWYIVTYDQAGSIPALFIDGGTGPDVGPHVAVDSHQNLLVTGGFNGTVNFERGSAFHILTSLASAGSDAFVASYTPTGTVQWIRTFGEATAAPDRLNIGTAIVPGPLSTVLVAGRIFGTPNFGTAANPFALSSLGDADGFLIKLSITGALATSP